MIGAACSAIAGVVALLLSREADADRARRAGARRRRSPTDAAPVRRDPSRPTLALLLAFVSGLTSLGYQVLWTRLLSSGTGNSTYVFTLILGIFLIGITLGAMFFSILRTGSADRSS